MSYGLQIWDANGNLEVDTTSRMCRFVGKFTFTNKRPILNSLGTPLTVEEVFVYPGVSGDGSWAVTGIGINGFILIGTDKLTVIKLAGYDTSILTFSLFRL